MMQVSCSILSILEKNIDCKRKINLINETNCDYLHLDIMDGKFIKNKTMDNAMILELVEEIQKPFDIHFMVSDIGSYIEIYQSLQPKYITFHYEATNQIDDWIHRIKKLGIGVGIAINPNTSITNIIPYLEKIDLVLVMSVEPGMGGQSFLETSISKIDQLRHLKEENEYHYMIEVDGGINDKIMDKVQNVDIVVSGSFITNADSYQEQINVLKSCLK